MLDIVRIAICDDEDKFLKELSVALNDYANKHRIDMGIDEFKDGFSLLDEFKRRKVDEIDSYDIVILDYEMTTINGLEVAREIRERNYPCEIVFLSNFEHFFREAFKVNTSRFLKKPIDKSELDECLGSYINKKRIDTPLLLKEHGGLIRINSADIMYLEGEGHRCYIHLENKIVCCWKTIGQVFNQMPKPYFYRLHRSFVVNMSYVDCTKMSMAIMKNGEQIPIASNKVKIFTNDFMTFSNSFNVRKT